MLGWVCDSVVVKQRLQAVSGTSSACCSCALSPGSSAGNKRSVCYSYFQKSKVLKTMRRVTAVTACASPVHASCAVGSPVHRLLCWLQANIYTTGHKRSTTDRPCDWDVT